MENSVQVIRNANGTLDILSRSGCRTTYIPNVTPESGQVDYPDYDGVSVLSLIIECMAALVSIVRKSAAAHTAAG